jgi:hypothetical protein
LSDSAGRIAVISLLAVLALATTCRGEEDSPTESARELMAPAVADRAAKAWELSADGIWLPDRESSDAAGDVGMTEGKLKVARSFRLNSSLSFTPEVSYSILHISAPAAARLPDNLHTVTAGLRTDLSLNPKLSISFLLAPGIAGDFNTVGGDDIRVRVGSTVRYTLSDKLTLLGGLIYQQGYKGTRALPVVGAIYRPTDRWTINLVAPRPGVTYSVSRGLRLNFGGELAGGEYQLHQRSIGADVIRYREFRVSGGADFALARNIKGELAGGYAFARRFSFYEVFDLTRRNIEVDSGPFLRAGVKLVW